MPTTTTTRSSNHNHHHQRQASVGDGAQLVVVVVVVVVDLRMFVVEVSGTCYTCYLVGGGIPICVYMLAFPRTIPGTW